LSSSYPSRHIYIFKERERKREEMYTQRRREGGRMVTGDASICHVGVHPVFSIPGRAGPTTTCTREYYDEENDNDDDDDDDDDDDNDDNDVIFIVIKMIMMVVVVMMILNNDDDVVECTCNSLIITKV
tara:strand:+ start:367 stop:750 length:384 start_codon:yes stop_codon:yes gene_type:complete